MGALREILAKFGFDVDDKNLDKAKQKTDAYADKLKEVAGVLLGEQLISGIRGFVSELQNQGDALIDAADRLNVNVIELQRWQLAAKLSGASAEDLNTGLKFLTKNLADAAGGAGDGAALFKKLGVDLKDSAGALKPANELLEDTLIGLSKIEEPAERSAAAMKLLGRGGMALLPLIKDGEEGLDGLLKKLDELGGGLSQDALDVIGEAGDRLDEFDFAVTSLKSHLAVTLFPALNQFIGWFTKTVVSVGKMTEGTHIFQAALLVLGGIATKVAIGMYAKYLPIIALLALAILLVDDLITFFKGGDSAAGRLLEKIFGEQAGRSIADRMRQDVKGLSDEVAKADSIGGAVAAVFSQIGSTLVKFYVDDIPEFLRRLFTDVTGLTVNFGGGLLTMFNDMFAAILASAISWVIDLVKGIVEGISNGLRDKWTQVSDTFKDLARGMIQDFKNIFKIKSPSEVLHDLTAMLPKGAIKALVTWAPRLRATAQDAFSMMRPETASFAPSVKVQTVSPVGPVGASRTTVDQKNTVQVVLKGDTPAAYRDATREGLGLAFDDERQAMLATLDPGVT